MGQIGFEPTTTWLWARRSTELSYCPFMVIDDVRNSSKVHKDIAGFYCSRSIFLVASWNDPHFIFLRNVLLSFLSFSGTIFVFWGYATLYTNLLQHINDLRILYLSIKQSLHIREYILSSDLPPRIWILFQVTDIFGLDLSIYTLHIVQLVILPILLCMTSPGHTPIKLAAPRVFNKEWYN